jgi:polyisoprenoid-binding protein YceI
MSTPLQADQDAVFVPAGTWTVDPAHSSVEFSVKHMMIATVKGRFTEFDGTLEVGEDAASAKVFGVIKVSSIDTHEPQRDAHLRSADFFDAEEYPEIRFESNRVEYVGDTNFRVSGGLTIQGITREVELDAIVVGTGRDPWGNERVALEIRGVTDRRDFGLRWNQALEAGGVLVGDKVKLAVDVSAVRAASARAA